MLAEPRIGEQRSAGRGGWPGTMQQCYPRVSGLADVLLIAAEHPWPAVVVFGPGGGRVVEGVPAGVLQPDQCPPALGAECDRDVAGPLGGPAGMPGERHSRWRFPAGD